MTIRHLIFGAAFGLACFLWIGPATVSQVLAQDLELHFKFDEENNVTQDSSGNDRHGELDDLEVAWVNDDERGGVLEFGGSTNGFLVTSIPDVSEGFTIMTWAYRDPLLCCGSGGANDGMFQVQLGTGDPQDLFPPSGAKVIGAWVRKSDAAVWGRVVTADGNNSLDTSTYFMEDEEWTHFAYRGDGELFEIVINGESGVGPNLDYDGSTHNEHDTIYVGRQGSETWGGRLDDVRVYSKVLTDEEIQAIMSGDDGGAPQLQAGDADQDLDFDQLDLVKVQIAAKYLTGQAATWGEGDWDTAPGGEQGSPPAGDGQFNQIDVIAALGPGHYLMGSYAAINQGGKKGDEQTSLVYDVSTGELSVDSPASKDLTSINVTSAGSKFIGDKPAVLDGAFDNFAADNIFKATFGGSFGDISFGNALPAGLSEGDVAADLTAVGSLAGGGDLGNVDLVYIPEPSTLLLIAMAMLGMLFSIRRSR